MAAPFRQRFPLSVSTARAILRCRGTVAAITGRCLTSGPVVIGRPSGFFGVGVTPGSALGVMGEQDPGSPARARKLTGSPASCAPKPSWCPGRALPRSRSGPVSPPLPSCASRNRSPAVPRKAQPAQYVRGAGADRWRTHLAAERSDVNAASSAAPAAAARTSGGQDTYSGPWNARTQPHPGGRQHHRPVRSAPGRHCHDPPARQRPAPGRPRLRPYGFPHPEHLRWELHDRLLPHWCPPAEVPRGRGLASMGGAAQ
jgi:hypothetical protein